MATNINILDDNGAQKLAEEIFLKIKGDYATIDALNKEIAKLQAQINSTDVITTLNPKINENGELIINYPEDEAAPILSINDAGYLILTDNGTATDAKIAKMSFLINDEGYLIVSA